MAGAKRSGGRIGVDSKMLPQPLHAPLDTLADSSRRFGATTFDRIAPHDARPASSCPEAIISDEIPAHVMLPEGESSIV
jgi:hypothetical protein